MYKYQFMLNMKFIGKPFPAKDLQDAIEIIKVRHFKGYNPTVLTIPNTDMAFITIPIPGRKKLTYQIEKTGLLVK